MSLQNDKDEMEDSDFKYLLQDVSSMYVGARFSYGELLEQEMVPFKLKAIITQYLYKEAQPETTLESQFYYLEKGTFMYETFKQLKVKIKITVQKEKKTLLGSYKWIYGEEVLSLQELTDMNLAVKKGKGIIIREIIFSKLGMLSFSV